MLQWLQSIFGRASIPPLPTIATDVTGFGLAGHGTDTLPGTEALFIPLVGSGGHLGAFGIALGKRKDPPTPSQWQIVETFVAQTALALERALLVERAASARVTSSAICQRAAFMLVPPTAPTRRAGLLPARVSHPRVLRGQRQRWRSPR